jgi:flagellar hook-associated protein 3 FlgL
MRVSSFSQHNLLMSQTQNLQARIADTNISISTGRSAQRYSGIATEAKQLLSLQASKSQLTQFDKNIDLVGGRLQAMETSVSNLVKIASDFRTRLLQGLNLNNASEMGIDVEAQNLLEQVASELNVQFDGRYLFGGSRTDVAPVDLNDPTFLTPPGTYPSTADTTYYQGDGKTLSARIGSDQTSDYGVNADASGFEKLIRALHLVATATVSPTPDSARLSDALDVITQSISEISIIQSGIGVSRSELDGATKTHQDTLTYIDQMTTNISDTDVAGAITQLSNDQATLQASFAAIAQIGQTSLLNYL